MESWSEPGNWWGPLGRVPLGSSPRNFSLVTTGASYKRGRSLRLFFSSHCSCPGYPVAGPVAFPSAVAGIDRPIHDLLRWGR